MTTYEISIADRVLRVEVRRDDGQVFVRVGDADEVRAELRSLHGALYLLTLGEQRTELAANVTGPLTVRTPVLPVLCGVG